MDPRDFCTDNFRWPALQGLVHDARSSECAGRSRHRSWPGDRDDRESSRLRRPAGYTLAQGSIGLESRPLAASSWAASPIWDTMRHSMRDSHPVWGGTRNPESSPLTAPRSSMAEYASSAEQRWPGSDHRSRGRRRPSARDGGRVYDSPRTRRAHRKPRLEGSGFSAVIAQMPGGIPVGTLALGKAGAINGAFISHRYSVRHIGRSARKTPGFQGRAT